MKHLSTTLKLDDGTRVWVTCIVWADMIMKTRVIKISTGQDISNTMPPKQFADIDTTLRHLAQPENIARAEHKQIAAYQNAIAADLHDYCDQRAQQCRAVA